MKKYSILLAAAAVFAAASCAKEAPAPEEIAPAGEQTQTTEEQTLTNPITITFSANAETKVSLEGEGTSGAKTAVWDENDRVTIIWFNSAESKMKSDTVTVASHGSASTTFTATVEKAAYYYAIYPATIDATLDSKGNFTVNFPNNAQAPTTFSRAAWYVAKTTMAAKDFAFHPISTVIKFTLDGSATSSPGSVYLCSMAGGLTKLYGTCPITFAEEEGYPLTVGVPSSDSAGDVTAKVSGTGTYYLSLPATGQTANEGGFVMQIQETGETIPAAHYNTTISLTPGKLYNINSAVDSKVIRDYYVATETKGSGGGLSPANAETIENLKANVPAFKYSTTIAGALLLNGTTINILGDATAYNVPIGAFNTNTSAPVHHYTIVGGIGEGATTFTTTASSSFNNAKASIDVSNITFSGCTANSAVNVSAGTISFDACTFSDNNATNGGAVTVGSDSASDSNLRVRFSNTIFKGNSASGGNGGAVFVVEKSTGGVVSFNNCLFEQNTANSTGKSGGAAYENNGSTALLFNNCSFTGINAASNGIVIYVNNSKGRLGMNNCTINGGTANKTNGALVTNKGLSIISNSTFWSKDGYGAWGLIALGASGTQNGSSIVNCLVRNGTATANTHEWPAFACNTNYYQNVQWCVYTGAKGVGSSGNEVSADKHTFANCWDLGVAQGQIINNSPKNATNATYGNKKIDGVTQYYYAWTNDLATAGFTKPTRDQIRNLIAKTAESTNDAKDGFGKLFLDWLDEVGGLDTDIKGAARPEGGFKPGSAE